MVSNHNQPRAGTSTGSQVDGSACHLGLHISYLRPTSPGSRNSHSCIRLHRSLFSSWEWSHARTYSVALTSVNRRQQEWCRARPLSKVLVLQPRSRHSRERSTGNNNGDDGSRLQEGICVLIALERPSQPFGFTTGTNIPYSAYASRASGRGSATSVHSRAGEEMAPVGRKTTHEWRNRMQQNRQSKLPPCPPSGTTIRSD
jgi:hypothetical protein